MHPPDGWYNGAWWLHLLRPLAVVYRAMAALRRGRLVRQRGELPLPVIVVGNITVGGTGKTPVVLALVDALQKSGFRPAIVSRGYGARPSRLPWRVRPDDDPLRSGDEPLLMARRSGVPVMLDPDRCRAIRALAADTDADVIISDDGLQHYAMARILEVAVVDGHRAMGNGLMLPAGPLREPVSRLREVDAVVVNGDPAPGLRDLLSDRSWHRVEMRARCWINLRDGRQLAADRAEFHGPVQALAGIGHPERFFATLRSLGLHPEEHVFADHHRYTARELTFAAGKTLLMTEKDAVKCEEFAESEWWYLQAGVELPGTLMDSVRERLRQRTGAGRE